MGLIYVFNLIVGTGALTLPAVFQGAGWLLSFFTILMLAFVGFVTVTFIIESMACANATLMFTRIQSHKIDSVSKLFPILEFSYNVTQSSWRPLHHDFRTKLDFIH